jgi:hypothetical protein
MNTVIQHKLYHYEELPPLSVWQDIEKELDAAKGDQQLKEKLFAQQVIPPLSVWNTIDAALATEMAEDLSARLYETEVAPPAAAWVNIETALDTRPVKRISPLRKYAIAAALIGIMVLAGIKFLNPSSGHDIAGIEVKKTTPSAPPSPLDLVIDNEPKDNKVAEETRNDIALEQSKRTFAKLDMNRRQKARIASGFHFASNNDDQLIADNTASEIADRYIVLMTPEGNFIRVSKKLGNLVCCVSGQEQDKECKDQVEKWKKQLACSSASHPGNFGDILSLISALQEGN